ncbi:hypothetical protein C9374_008148 [Naegleria lovaniensis]|uniref:Ankyrin repeat domain-containing protein n=1 Tax=Naegleria lovaniensis TaxID=51637 RepID=A0AA88KL57_NAELO|nr:uncharacterized protein C9374_008148 [Naegleria lovaniensis]KAG2378509.1 hypothetical protein C9374_008148 [Naegleria lovaniensis]
MAQQSSTKDLYDAVTKGDVAAVKKIVESGKADLNAFSPVGIFESETPLFAASFKGNKEIVSLLVSKGAKVELGDNSLHGAASKDNVEILEVLVKAGLSVNSKSYVSASLVAINLLQPKQFGDTPLHIASYFGRVASVEELLRLGADKSIKNNLGKTAHDIAEARGQSMVSRLVKI